MKDDIIAFVSGLAVTISSMFDKLEATILAIQTMPVDPIFELVELFKIVIIGLLGGAAGMLGKDIVNHIWKKAGEWRRIKKELHPQAISKRLFYRNTVFMIFFWLIFFALLISLVINLVII